MGAASSISDRLMAAADHDDDNPLLQEPGQLPCFPLEKEPQAETSTVEYDENIIIFIVIMMKMTVGVGF